MATAYNHLEKRERILTFGKSRISEINGEIGDLEAEKVMWEDIIEMQDPCERCGGFGKLRHHIAQDETRYEDCPACKGSGKRQNK